MIYTVGHAESYEQYFREQILPCKQGRTKDYEGGTVWKTFAEAKAYVTNHPELKYAVYGVVAARWGIDTETSRSGEPWHDLLVTSPLLQLDQGRIMQADRNRV